VNARTKIGSHYIRQRGALLRFLTRHTRDPDLAQDLLQETWLRVAHMSGAVIENPRRYLFQIAGNLAIDYFRAEKRRRLQTGEVDALLSIPDDEPSPEAVAIGRSDLTVITDALDDMPARRRAILLMSRVEGLTYRAIADHFGISTRTVEFEIVRALDFCRDRLKEIAAPDSDRAD
jgi:RNA polymerase sigma factor (sigma-70 family)